MLKIRLKREGVKNKPFYRIVVVNSKTKNKGGSLEVLGFYNPIKKIFKVDKEKLSKWLTLGAQSSEAINKLLEG